MTISTMDAALRAENLAFAGPGVERLVDNTSTYAHPTYCNKRFCKIAVIVAQANAMTEADIASTLRACIDAADFAAYLALASNVT